MRALNPQRPQMIRSWDLGYGKFEKVVCLHLVDCWHVFFFTSRFEDALFGSSDFEALAHARHGPPERLQSHGRPNAGFLASSLSWLCLFLRVPFLVALKGNQQETRTNFWGGPPKTKRHDTTSFHQGGVKSRAPVIGHNALQGSQKGATHLTSPPVVRTRGLESETSKRFQGQPRPTNHVHKVAEGAISYKLPPLKRPTHTHSVNGSGSDWGNIGIPSK